MFVRWRRALTAVPGPSNALPVFAAPGTPGFDAASVQPADAAFCSGNALHARGRHFETYPADARSIRVGGDGGGLRRLRGAPLARRDDTFPRPADLAASMQFPPRPRD